MDFNLLLNEAYLIAANLALLGVIGNVSLCLLNRKKLSQPISRLFYFLILNLIIEILAIFFTKSGMNNLPLLHFYTLGEFILFSWFYKSIISKPKVFQSKFRHFLIIGVLLILLNSIFYQSIYEFNSLSKTFVQLSIISYAVLYFYDLLENQDYSPVVAKSLRLINSAVLIYYSGSLFIFMCSQFSFENTKVYTLFWTFNAVLNIIFQLLIFCGLWKIFYKKTAFSS